MFRFCKHCKDTFPIEHFYVDHSKGYDTYICKLHKNQTNQKNYLKHNPTANVLPYIAIPEGYVNCFFCKCLHPKTSEYWNFEKDNCKKYLETVRLRNLFKQRVLRNMDPRSFPENCPEGMHWCKVHKGLFPDSHFYIHPTKGWYRCKANCQRITTEFNRKTRENKKLQETVMDWQTNC